MIRLKKNVIANIFFLFFVYYIILPWIFHSKERPIKTEYDIVSPVQNAENEDYEITYSTSFTLNTRGCYIPSYIDKVIYESKFSNITCGQRFVHIENWSRNQIRFSIDGNMYKVLGEEELHCGYIGFKSLDVNSSLGIFSNIVPFTDGHIGRLTDEQSVFVICSIVPPNEFEHLMDDLPPPVYTDFYALFKKKHKMRKNYTKKKKWSKGSKRWNVLLLGVESMSRGRVHNSMPELVEYFNLEGWLDFRAFQKVSEKKNMWALLTGNKDAEKHCKNFDLCRNMFLFHKYKSCDYVTALGEDVLPKDEKFIPKMGAANFTDHYLKILAEGRKGNFKCYGEITSAEQMLIYAFQFAQSYRTNGFFGMFFSSTFSGINPSPEWFQKKLMDFFRGLKHKGLLENTFVIFFGDPGMNFRPAANRKQDYYDRRLPGLFIWVPYNFREMHLKMYRNLEANQKRLMTFYDLHTLLEHILKMSDSSAKVSPVSCVKCQSLFEELPPERTCDTANIEESLCTCHNMSESKEDDVYSEIASVVMQGLKERFLYMSYKKSDFSCQQLVFDDILKSYFYHVDNRTFYVVTGMFDSGDVFESIVEKLGSEYRLLSLQSLTESENKSHCVNDYDPAKGFCTCIENYK